MTQQSTKKEYNTFVKGVITEAGALTFPENASLAEENCVLNRDGSRQRRLGMDFENDFVLVNADLAADDAVAATEWKNVANRADLHFAVVQVGGKVLIFDAAASSISGALLSTLDFDTTFGFDGKTTIDFDYGLGYLFCTFGQNKPVYISYNPSTGVFDHGIIDIKIRDTFGLDDGLRVDEQPVSLSTNHSYNLQNQGWSVAVISTYHSAASRYPSNANVWFIGKDTNDDFVPALMDKQDFGSTAAPRGRFIIDAFARSASRDAQYDGSATPTDVETSYPRAVAFAFQRVWYAGVVSAPPVLAGAPNMTGFVFYSRAIRNSKDFGVCYPEADPTSEVDSELVDTDGGYINIPDSGQIYKLVPLGGSMIVFAEKGIWEISGDQGGFRATANRVDFITSFGLIGSQSVVDMEDSIAYWNKGGIYLLSPNPESGRLSAKNVTEETIQTRFNELDKVTKQYAVGNYDPINRRVSWMYNDSSDYTGATFRNKYTKEIVLDSVLGAFYFNTISSHTEISPFIAGYLETPDFLLREEGIRSRGDSVTKYLTVQYIDPDTDTSTITFSYYRDPHFRDWRSLDDEGTSFVSFAITGYELMGDSARRKQAAYLTTHFKQTEKAVVLDENGLPTADNPSGCLIQAQWDWSDDESSGKWGEQFQAYRLLRPIVLGNAGDPIKYGQEVVTTKSRLPGTGKALSLLIKSDGDKDFYLYGWAINYTGSTHV